MPQESVLVDDDAMLLYLLWWPPLNASVAERILRVSCFGFSIIFAKHPLFLIRNISVK